MRLWIFFIPLATFASVRVASNIVLRNEERVLCTTDECNEFARKITTSMNPLLDPCVDFYEYACGNWPKQHPIPRGKHSWSFLMEAAEENKRKVENLLKEESQDDEIPPVKIVKKWYKACVDTEAMEKRGMEPLVTTTNAIGGWPLIMPSNEWNENKYKWQIIDDYYAHLTGVNIMHETRVSLYGANSTNLSVVLDFARMPTATWLLNSEVIEVEEPDSNETLAEGSDDQELEKILNSRKEFKKDGKYWKFITTIVSAMMKSTGSNVPKTRVEGEIEDILNFQWKLDKLTYYFTDDYTNNTVMDFQNWYNDLGRLTENAKVNWARKVINIFKEAKVELDLSTQMKVVSLKYFRNLASLLNRTSSRTIVNYLHWSFISKAILSTTEQMRKLYERLSIEDEEEEDQTSRAEKCIDEAKMNDIIAYEYIRKLFCNGTVKMALDAIDDIQEEIQIQIEGSNWADEELKNWAIRKLRTISKNIGYPDWYNNATIMKHYFEGLNISSRYYENSLILGRYYTLKELRTLKYEDNIKPWIVDPLTINAFYLTKGNAITIPAANLQKPFFSEAQPDTINYALTGHLLSHEMYHAFGEQRHTFDEHGEEIKWSKDMENKYNQSVQCFLQQFDNYTLDGTPNGPKVKNYGNQTLEENMSDTMGIQTAFKAFKRKERTSGKPIPGLQGLEMFNNHQLFFLSFTNLWCNNVKPDLLATLAKLDMHSTGRLRTIGSLSNSKDFAETFGCPVGSSMNPTKKCNIWYH